MSTVWECLFTLTITAGCYGNMIVCIIQLSTYSETSFNEHLPIAAISLAQPLMVRVTLVLWEQKMLPGVGNSHRILLTSKEDYTYL